MCVYSYIHIYSCIDYGSDASALGEYDILWDFEYDVMTSAMTTETVLHADNIHVSCDNQLKRSHLT